MNWKRIAGGAGAWWMVLLLSVWAGGDGAVRAVFAAEAAPTAGVRPADYRSRHFLLHTDLGASEARELLRRLEATLSICSRYWGQSARGVIECYVVDDLTHWSDEELAHPMARVIVGGIGGAAFVRDRMGDQEPRTTIYADARPGVVEHETVHAYCLQTFGGMGPDWYKEGMAEMAYYEGRGPAASCPGGLAAALRGGDARSVAEVIGGGAVDRSLDRALRELGAFSSAVEVDFECVPLGDWAVKNKALIESARGSYLWNWTLCHLLSQNANYSRRFRMLGRAYVNDQPARFEDAFAPMMNELCFEYGLYLRHVDRNYRVDLCRWDWSTPFAPLDKGKRSTSRIAARRGYQATGLEVARGERFRYRAEGAWSIDGGRTKTGARGEAPRGGGRLVGAVLKQGYELSEPFGFGEEGVFTAPEDGKLYLRAWDRWNELHDNQGQLHVQFELVESETSPGA